MKDKPEEKDDFEEKDFESDEDVDADKDEDEEAFESDEVEEETAKEEVGVKIKKPSARAPKKKGNLFQMLKSLSENVFSKLKSPKVSSQLQKGKAAIQEKAKALGAIKMPPVAKEAAGRVMAGPLAMIFKHKKLLILIVLIGIGAVVAKKFFLGKDKGSLEEMVAQQPESEKSAVAVKGFKIGRFNFEDSLNVLGTVKGAIEFKLAFEVPGVISSINYREGERYEEGALLLSLRQDDILLRLKRAQAAARKAQTDVQIAENKAKEHETLFAMGAIPKTTLDKVKTELEGVKYEYEAARLEMKAHEAMLEKSNLYAPSAGMIGELNVEEGETITPNTMLGSHVMTEYVFAEFGIVERDVKKIALGQKARVFVDAYADKTFEGVIENVAPVVGGTSRTATARVRLENPERLLLPGMFSRIRVLLYSKKNTLVVPTDCIQGTEGDQWVFVVDTEKKVAQKRAITVGYTRPDYSQIDAGISEGEIVAISGLERLEDGNTIRLLETQEAET